MPTGQPVERFLEALADLDVGWTRIEPGGVRGAVAEALREPAVGVPLDVGDLPPAVDTDLTPARLERATTGVTPAIAGIADYGSVVLSATPEGVEPASLFPERHVAVLRAGAVVPGMPEAFDLLVGAGSAVVATGPSATADMGEPVRGAHGPREVHVVLVDDE